MDEDWTQAWHKPFCLRGSCQCRCQRDVQILLSTFTQHLIWAPQSTPTKGHSFSDLCISGHFWRRQRCVCYGLQNIYLSDTLLTSSEIEVHTCRGPKQLILDIFLSFDPPALFWKLSAIFSRKIPVNPWVCCASGDV